MISETVHIRWLDHQEYEPCWQAMRQFTDHRDENTIDEIWVVEHPPVFTQGQSGKPEHILNPGHIPIVQVDRGGQVTYHGPGQLVIYPLVDLKRKKLNVRQIVTILEQSVIQLLKEYNIESSSQCKAPGVYVDNKKICSLGLRIRRGCSFHGLALNVNMDLEPFTRINPCGYSDLQMTQMAEFITSIDIKQVSHRLIDHLTRNLGYTSSLQA